MAKAFLLESLYGKFSSRKNGSKFIEKLTPSSPEIYECHVLNEKLDIVKGKAQLASKDHFNKLSFGRNTWSMNIWKTSTALLAGQYFLNPVHVSTAVPFFYGGV